MATRADNTDQPLVPYCQRPWWPTSGWCHYSLSECENGVQNIGEGAKVNDIERKFRLY